MALPLMEKNISKFTMLAQFRLDAQDHAGVGYLKKGEVPLRMPPQSRILSLGTSEPQTVSLKLVHQEQS